MNKEINYENLCLSILEEPTNLCITRVELIRYFGSSDPASFLAFLINKYRYYRRIGGLTPDSFFYATVEDVEKYLGLSRCVQETCIRKLKKENLIEMEVRTKETRRYFHIFFENVCPLLINDNTNGRESDNLAFVEKPTTCENTTNGHESEVLAFANARKSRTIIKTNNKNKSILNAKAYSGGKPPQHKTIQPRKANDPLILVDTTIPPLARPEGAKPRFNKLHRIKPTPITFDIQQIIDYWIAKGLPGHNENSKSFDQAVIYITKAFNATLLEDFIDPKFHNYRFSVDSIKRSIDNFYLAAFDSKYEPLSPNTKQRLQSIRLKDFFYNPHSPDDQYKSHLFLYLSKRKLVSESNLLVMKDTHPFCTNKVKEWYTHEFGGMVTEVSRQQQNAMILVGRKLEEFLVTHKDKLQMDDGMRMYGNYNPLNFLAEQLLRCESKILRENDGLRSIFQPSWLISENMLTDRFIYFLKSERMMK